MLFNHHRGADVLARVDHQEETDVFLGNFRLGRHARPCLPAVYEPTTIALLSPSPWRTTAKVFPS